MPSPFVRKAEETAWERRQAAEAEAAYLDALTAGRGGFTGKIAAPEAARKVRTGWGTSEYRRRHGGEYDWFDGLSKAEQARIRENWFSHDPGAVSPDEVEAMGLPMSEWLALTRGVDVARTVKAGRRPKRERYGGADPANFLLVGRPEDHGQRVRRFTSKRDGSKWHDIDRGARVQYFTDKEGRVHPIRASYQAADARYNVSPRGELVRTGRRDYGADEAF